MKKLIFALMVAVLPMCSYAQNEGLFAKKNTAEKTVDYTPYMQGAIPEENGKVTFAKTIDAAGKSKDELYLKIASWASARYSANLENGKWTDHDYFRNLEMASIKVGDKANGHIQCQAHEELVFSNKFLEKDYTIAEYILDIVIKDGSVSAKVTDIVYTYTFVADKERKTAEEYITDEASFTKKGKIIKANRKFRVKTVNLANELFSEIETVIK